MSDMLDMIKEKYSEEVGASFTFFEIISFFMYLIVSYVVFCEDGSGVWGTILLKSVDDIFFTDNSIITRARVADFLASGLLTLLTITIYKKFSNISYRFLSTLKNMDDYVRSLKLIYDIDKIQGQAMRIYIANTAKEQKQLEMKEISTVKGVGLLSLVIAFSSLIGLLNPNFTDALTLTMALIVLFFVQWSVFAKYTAHVVPRLVLERLARDEDVRFGDELND